MINSVNPEQMPCCAVSDLGLHFLQRPICPNTYGLLWQEYLYVYQSDLESLLLLIIIDVETLMYHRVNQQDYCYHAGNVHSSR